MSLHPLLSTAVLSLGLATAALPALARPEIASGDQLLTTSSEGCLARADRLIADLGVAVDTGSIDRTGYFEDGTFRILCYGAGEQSMAVVFASHDSSLDTATAFVRMALDQLAQAPGPPAVPSEPEVPPVSAPDSIQ